jgi:hypothetical protein
MLEICTGVRNLEVMSYESKTQTISLSEDLNMMRHAGNPNIQHHQGKESSRFHDHLLKSVSLSAIT